MSPSNNKILLTIATIVIVVAYLFWGVVEKYTGVDIYFPAIALFICLISYYIYANHKYTISFILFWLSVGNFIDELFFDNTALYLTEIGYSVVVLCSAYFYNRKRLKNAVKP